ncbi:MAG TPA: class I SAM-dependent methyltransferase [Verrucomicrobiota bacterium]|nr:class I SAM-dependent methyltransferase [Verrucomicrobiota bacterium]
MTDRVEQPSSRGPVVPGCGVCGGRRSRPGEPMPGGPCSDAIERACPVCDGRESETFWEKGALRAVRCAQCGMVYANPVAESLATGRFYDALGTDYYLSPAKLESDYQPVRFERELRLFRAFCKRGAVLDVGCSSGAFLHHLRRCGDYRVTGVDVAGAPLDYAEAQGIEVVRAPFLEHDFGGRRFEAVTFWAVLEHLVNPGAFLHRAAALLVPGGHCCALVPNLGSLAIRVCGARYRYVMPDHVNYFSPATLRAFAAREGAFDLVMLRSTHFNPVVLWQDWRRMRDRVPENERAELLRRTTRLKQSQWLGPARLLYRGVEGLLGAGLLADNLAIVLRRRPT